MALSKEKRAALQAQLGTNNMSGQQQVPETKDIRPDLDELEELEADEMERDARGEDPLNYYRPDSTPPEDLEEMEAYKLRGRDYQLANHFTKQPHIAVEPPGRATVPTLDPTGLNSFFTSFVVPPTSVTAITQLPQERPLVYGLNIPQDATWDEKMRILEDVYTYVGAQAVEPDGYVNKWLECLGCVVMPVNADVTDPASEENGGEITTTNIDWEVPLFKLAEKNREGEHIIIGGGGASGKRFAQQMTSIFGPGDWKTPVEIRITQEARQGISATTGRIEPRRRYIFGFRRIRQEGKKGTR
jgi:hypothetical protein